MLNIKPYPTTIFLFWKCCLLFKPAAYFQMHFRHDFLKHANNVNPDQTGPWDQSDQSSCCLQYKGYRRM